MQLQFTASYKKGLAQKNGHHHNIIVLLMTKHMSMQIVTEGVLVGMYNLHVIHPARKDLIILSAFIYIIIMHT